MHARTPVRACAQGLFRRPEACKYRYAVLVKGWQAEHGDEAAALGEAHQLHMQIMPKAQASGRAGLAWPGLARATTCALSRRARRKAARCACAHVQGGLCSCCCSCRC